MERSPVRPWEDYDAYTSLGILPYDSHTSDIACMEDRSERVHNGDVGVKKLRERGDVGVKELRANLEAEESIRAQTEA